MWLLCLCASRPKYSNDTKIGKSSFIRLYLNSLFHHAPYICSLGSRKIHLCFQHFHSVLNIPFSTWCNKEISSCQKAQPAERTALPERAVLLQQTMPARLELIHSHSVSLASSADRDVLERGCEWANAALVWTVSGVGWHTPSSLWSPEDDSDAINTPVLFLCLSRRQDEKMETTASSYDCMERRWLMKWFVCVCVCADVGRGAYQPVVCRL